MIKKSFGQHVKKVIQSSIQGQHYVDRDLVQFTSATLYGRLVRTSSDFGPVPLEILHKIVDVEEENPLWTTSVLSFIFGKQTDEFDIKAGSQLNFTQTKVIITVATGFIMFYL